MYICSALTNYHFGLGVGEIDGKNLHVSNLQSVSDNTGCDIEMTVRLVTNHWRVLSKVSYRWCRIFSLDI